ncbi:MAG: hypothetical protein F8N36_13285 [Desulfovibrio sp.]|uniref:hypothetical protein n=1 Tax=Desulfovibrio sp. TaxID=885 RepID=UPI00135E21AC|nr:hypothetical protein [Desulfovibrio sp.]MTJ93812.1 hypothetical protein [Desulfovibrio sp.]
MKYSHRDSDDYFLYIFPLVELQNKSILWVSCGVFIANLWAQHGTNITAVDFNSVAVAAKSSVLNYRLAGCVQAAGGEPLSFAGSGFDCVY